MVDCEGLKTINNLYTAIKISAHMVKEGVGGKASPVHAGVAAEAPHARAAAAEATHTDAGVAAALHAEAAGADTLHGDVEGAPTKHAGAAADALHADAAGAEAPHAGAAADALHSDAGVAVAFHAGAVAAGLAVDAVASDRSSDGEYGVGAGALRGASEERLGTRVCAVVPTNKDGGVVCHLRSLLPLGCVLLAGFSLACKRDNATSITCVSSSV